MIFFIWLLVFFMYIIDLFLFKLIVEEEELICFYSWEDLVVNLVKVIIIEFFLNINLVLIILFIIVIIFYLLILRKIRCIFVLDDVSFLGLKC